MAPKILIVEDDAKIVRTLRLYLEKNGYSVIPVYDGGDALFAFRRHRPELVLLDLNLPGVDGLEVCRSLRRESNVPIIMLTARVEETDRLIGLELGADDYIVKPFSPREVVARIRAVLRRVSGEFSANEFLHAGELVLDLSSHQASLGITPIELTRSEFEILTALMRKPGAVLSRSQLLDETQGLAYSGYERNIDQHIKNLRKKFRQLSSDYGDVIETVYGVGYRFNPSLLVSEANGPYGSHDPE